MIDAVVLAVFAATWAWSAVAFCGSVLRSPRPSSVIERTGVLVGLAAGLLIASYAVRMTDPGGAPAALALVALVPPVLWAAGRTAAGAAGWAALVLPAAALFGAGALYLALPMAVGTVTVASLRRQDA